MGILQEKHGNAKIYVENVELELVPDSLLLQIEY